MKEKLSNKIYESAPTGDGRKDRKSEIKISLGNF